MLRNIRALFRINTDFEKWEDASRTWGALNPIRSECAASLIPDNTRVLDIGAGSMELKKHLKAHCTYVPSDIHDRGEGCIVADLNNYEFPEGQYDWITLIGVLEYVKDIRWVLTRAHEAASNVLVTYNTLENNPNKWSRRKRGWMSHLVNKDLLKLFRDTGWDSVEKPVFDTKIYAEVHEWYILRADK